MESILVQKDEIDTNYVTFDESIFRVGDIVRPTAAAAMYFPRILTLDAKYVIIGLAKSHTVFSESACSEAGHTHKWLLIVCDNESISQRWHPQWFNKVD